MKTYPKINGTISNIEIYAFDKLDGSNIRAEWSKKRGFYKFGTRKTMFDERNPQFGEAKLLIIKKYEADIAKAMKKAGYDRGVFFFEFFGPNSAFGYHADEEHDVVLFDANINKIGMLPPKEFLKLFGHLDIAPLLYKGKPNENFLEEVKGGKLSGMTFEGVVCKAAHPNKRGVLMFKVKSLAWYTELRAKCGKDEKLFEELA